MINVDIKLMHTGLWIIDMYEALRAKSGEGEKEGCKEASSNRRMVRSREGKRNTYTQDSMV